MFTGNRGHLQDLFESFLVKGLKHAPLVTISQRMQMQKRLLSVHGIVVFETPEDSSIAATKKLFRAMIGGSFSNTAELRRLLARSLADPGELLRLAYRLRVQKRAATPKKGPILFEAQCEMAPNPDSRVLLKAYAADYCGTATLREASRELVEGFINDLSLRASKDLPGLVCQLNSYAKPPEVGS